MNAKNHLWATKVYFLVLTSLMLYIFYMLGGSVMNISLNFSIETCAFISNFKVFNFWLSSSCVYIKSLIGGLS